MRKVVNPLPLAGVLVFILICLTGCASMPIPAPTLEESLAARAYKKTVAIVECKDEGSPIRGVDSLALPTIESLFMGRTNLVERQAIGKIFNERSIMQSASADNAQEIGKLLGAHYIVAANTIVSLSDPEISQSASRSKKGKFYGSINDEVYAHAEVAIRIIDTSTSEIVYAGKKEADQRRTFNSESFEDEGRFKQALQQRTQALRIKQAKGLALGRMEKANSEIISNAVAYAAAQFQKDVSALFSQSGEILEILSSRQVTVNLGSAYGIKPGDPLIIWQLGPSFKDPKTGTLVMPKNKQAVLKVVKVTSGLSCVAQGAERDVKGLKIGDKLYTH